MARRGRPRLDYVFDPSNPVYRARKAIDNAREEFDRETARRWEQHAARLRNDLYETLLNEVNKGTSISEICRMYKTTSRNAIYDLIAQAKEVYGSANETKNQAEEVKIEAIGTHPDGFPNAHRVTLSTGEVAEVYVYGGSLRLISTQDGTQVRDALLDESGDLYETIKKEVL